MTQSSPRFLRLFQIFIHRVGADEFDRALDAVLAVLIIPALIAVVVHRGKVGDVVIQGVHVLFRQGIGRLIKGRPRLFIHRLFVGVRGGHDQRVVVQTDVILRAVLLAEFGILTELGIDGAQQMQYIVVDTVADIAGLLKLCDRRDILLTRGFVHLLRKDQLALFVDMRLQQQGVRQARAGIDHHRKMTVAKAGFVGDDAHIRRHHRGARDVFDVLLLEHSVHPADRTAVGLGEQIGDRDGTDIRLHGKPPVW